MLDSEPVVPKGQPSAESQQPRSQDPEILEEGFGGITLQSQKGL